jgi:hypothetical protein
VRRDCNADLFSPSKEFRITSVKKGFPVNHRWEESGAYQPSSISLGGHFSSPRSSSAYHHNSNCSRYSGAPTSEAIAADGGHLKFSYLLVTPIKSRKLRVFRSRISTGSVFLETGFLKGKTDYLEPFQPQNVLPPSSSMTLIRSVVAQPPLKA